MKNTISMKKLERTTVILKYIVLFVFGVVLMAPFVWMISVGFDRTANIVMPFPPRLIPEAVSSFNYGIVFENGRLIQAYLNSAIVTVSSVFLSVSASLLAGYAFSKGKFKGKRVLFVIVLCTLMIPMEPRLIPLYTFFNQLGLLNTFWPLILPSVISGMLIFLCKQFFDQLPDTLREAAQIDGAGEFKIFFRVYLPLAGPIAATMVILSFIWSWNDFMWPLVVINDLNLQTIPLYLASFSLENGSSLGGLTMALATVSVLPIVIVYLFLQKYIIQSIALSGVKGE
ncbi:sugar ABC transporter permease [Niallia circulans]|jgi:multiple sugar transport system permease protein|uniref:Sugar ABC transporter permease n=1 Tax=Niallia circulans TaxID=1397 RepID=A0A0J1ILX1_NIACI|nr:carbohydrate ABC transporter permease [Niallia circulans]KLV26962.1 sugar ABC transporter permease [Niallia circulans]MDR4318016.1 carbohydrate ABC transporter permease [Niallia circulans]MED3839087.1 carbohydrate ABC transporter permease [Niallia circulans]MED4242202.1 carbohydrate ABC transporter permease [Niallia circulans]MED4250690.1 carbohydrate ABC transporter permease [Niallia circulans]